MIGNLPTVWELLAFLVPMSTISSEIRSAKSLSKTDRDTCFQRKFISMLWCSSKISSWRKISHGTLKIIRAVKMIRMHTIHLKWGEIILLNILIGGIDRIGNKFINDRSSLHTKIWPIAMPCPPTSNRLKTVYNRTQVYHSITIVDSTNLGTCLIEGAIHMWCDCLKHTNAFVWIAGQKKHLSKAKKINCNQMRGMTEICESKKKKKQLNWNVEPVSTGNVQKWL